MFLNVTLLRVNHIYHYQKNYNIIVRVLLIPREARCGVPSREVYNLVAREARVYHASIARPA